MGNNDIKSVAQFVESVINWKINGKRPIAFRGQAYWKWPTEPKIFRKDVGVYDHEKKIVRDLVSLHPQEFRDDNTMFDRLVRMQHFDLPTRLLDVTTNPLVALYFATEKHIADKTEQDGKVQGFSVPESRQRYYDSDLVSCLSNIANLTSEEKSDIASAFKLPKLEFNKSDAIRRLSWFIKIENPHFEPNIDKSDLNDPVYVKPKMSNRRIIAQYGAFMIYGRKLVRVKKDDDLLIHRLTIRSDAKGEIRKELEVLGIHASTLFPEIDKASDFIVRRYQNGA